MNARPTDADQRGRVLAVDDSDFILAILRKSLEALGYRVVCAASGEAALIALRAESFDVVILDVEMPYMSGIELAHRLRGRLETSSLMLAFHTTLAEDAVRRQFPAYDVFLPKPCPKDILGVHMAELVRIARTEGGSPHQVVTP